MSWLLIALRNILRDAKRVSSTVLIIAVGLAALLVGSGFMLSTYDSLQEIAIRSEGHVIVLNEPKSDVGGIHQQLTLSKWQDVQDELLFDDRVASTLPRARFEGIISHGNYSASFQGTGVDPAEEFRVWGPFLNTPKGELLDPWLGEGDTPDVMLGSQLINTLRADIGDLLTLHALGSDGQSRDLQVRLSGTLHTGTKELDDHTLQVNISSVEKLLGTSNISQLSVYLLEGRDDTAAVKENLQQLFPDLEIQSWDQRAELHDKVKAMYDRIFGVMGVIILVVVFLAISNTVALAIYQRHDEIATLGAIGTPASRICMNFVIEALLIGIIAVSVGMALGYALATAVNLAGLWMPAPPGRTEGHPLYIYISMPHYLATSVVLIAITIIASMAAAYKATKVNITDALA